jgi:hypothetical protein
MTPPNDPKDRAPRAWQYVRRYISPNGTITAVFDGPKIAACGDKFWLVHKEDYDALEAKLTEALAERDALNIEVWQCRGALGYPVPGYIKEDTNLRCGMCDAKTKERDALKQEVERLQCGIAEHILNAARGVKK